MEGTGEFKKHADLVKEGFKSMGSGERAKLGLQEILDGVLARIAHLEDRQKRLDDLSFEEKQELVTLRKKTNQQN